MTSDADRRKITSMASVGISLQLIAKRMGCTVEDLERQYERELQRALPEVKAQVGAGLFAAAKNGNIAAIIFWLKTRAGWREKGYPQEPAEPTGPQWMIKVPGWPQYVTCKGFSTCPKIADPHERRAAYEKALGAKLPVLQDNEYPREMTPEERQKKWVTAKGIAQLYHLLQYAQVMSEPDRARLQRMQLLLDEERVAWLKRK